jgi:NAD(P)-dependent dehydrogenase (short-subunit alcohol dehydrogenase family)
VTANKRVLITGGAGMVGRSLVEGFARASWQVVLTSRSQERAEKVAEEFQQATDASVYGVAAEFGGPTDRDEISRLVENLKRSDLLPTCLVNNARDRENLKLDEQGRPFTESWVQEFHLDVVVAYELTMGLASHRGLHSVINIASMYGVVAPTLRLYQDPKRESPIHYGVCKAALIHLTKELSVRLASKEIRVNAISYGGIKGRVSQEFLERYADLCPQGRMLDCTDIAGPALFLASDESACGITGHNLVVDGGWSVW